jgi:2-oxoisovalerate dehydrogenase E1 component alpha subunit
VATISGAATELDAELPRIYRAILLTRALDERIWALSQQGRIGITGPVRGHEAAQVGSAWALRARRDIVYPYYRDVGVVVTLGMTALDILLGALDKGDDPFSGARQMPFHFTSPPLRVPSPSTSVATQIPHAVGAALASRLRGEDAVTIVYFGDGAVSKGDFHEGVNFAAVWKLPVIFFCENNQYAISIPLRLQMPVATVAERAAAYGLPGERFDGTSVLESYRATRRAVERARAGDGPTLLEALVYRLGPHTSHDDDTRYRTREEVASWEARDPIALLRADLLERGIMTVDREQALAADVHGELDDALARAEAAPDPARPSAFCEILADHVVPNPFDRAGSARRQDSEGIFATGTHVTS